MLLTLRWPSCTHATQSACIRHGDTGCCLEANEGLMLVRAGVANTGSAPPVDSTEPKAVLPWPLPLPLGLLPLKVLAVLRLHWGCNDCPCPA